MITAYGRIGRVVTAAGIATSCVGLTLGLLRRRRREPVPVTRGLLDGIAYDLELEICPECAKTQGVTGPDGDGNVHYSETAGGAR